MQQEQLKPGARSLDIGVIEEMNRILGKELVGYVDDLRKAMQVPSSATSGDSCELVEEGDLEELKAVGMD